MNLQTNGNASEPASALSKTSNDALRSMLLDQRQRTVRPDVEVGTGALSILAGGTFGQRDSANILLNKRYAWRGYQTSGLPDAQRSDSVTLVASEQGAVVGTMTIGFDGPQGLLADDLFLDKTDRVRGEGREVCEFTKLAMDSVKRSKQTLASLFHVAFIVARRIRGADDLLIEVNPRHVAYYQRMLGFEAVSEERLNLRVDAPAVLLSIDLAWGQEQIARFNGNKALAVGERTLYPYFFNVEDENRIFHKLVHHGH